MGHKQRVLIVEHNDRDRLILEGLLIDAGILPHHIFAYKQSPLIDLQHQTVALIDLIFLDLMLPDENGFAILQALQTDPYLQQIPVVATTDNIMGDTIAKVRQAGFGGFMGKPIDRVYFPTMLQRIFAGEKVGLTE